ncbi:MAG: nuclear transport factor 2 family protein [Terriglobia bacterium]
MRRFLLSAVMSVALVSIVGTQIAVAQGADETAKQEILKIQDEWNQALVKKDLSFIRQLYDDNIAYTNTQGVMLTKARLIDLYKSGVLIFYRMSHDDIKVNIFGETAVLTGRSTSKMAYKGRVSYGPRRFTNVFVKENGRWRLVAHQVSLIPKG